MTEIEDLKRVQAIPLLSGRETCIFVIGLSLGAIIMFSVAAMFVSDIGQAAHAAGAASCPK